MTKKSKNRKHNLTMNNGSLQDTLDFIKEWKQHGDIKKVASKYKLDPSTASKILSGKKGIHIEFLAELKAIAVKNHAKLSIN
jgi:hypothetical protein